MFGIVDVQIWIGYALSLGFTLACIAYGLMNWNRGGVEEGGS
jgi:hypothetical protein